MGDSDSENEGSQTNVSRLVIRPPGHTGKAQKGHLAFEATFESANLGRVDFVSDTEYDIYIRPDTCNPRHRFWFFFSIENTQENQRIIFNVVNISKSRNLLMNGLTPVVKSTSRPRWQRMPTSHVFYHRSPAHGNAYVLSFAFCFDKEDENYQFAMCQPFTYSRHKLCMEKLISQQYDYVVKETLGKSVFDKGIDLITISAPVNLANKKEAGVTMSLQDEEEEAERKRIKVVFIMARVHPGETPSSFVVQGLIDFLVSSHDIAASLREYVVFKIIPMLNPDGVFLGNQRCNLVGQDLNRAWADTNLYLNAEIVEIKKKLLFYDNHPRYDLDLVLDIHAHTALTGLFIYGNSYDDVYRYERHIVFPKILAQNCDDFNSNNTIYNADQKKSGSVRRHMTSYLSHEVNTYTLEVSLLGYEDKDRRQIVPYTDDLYAKIGRNVTRAFWDYYKIVGTIPLEDSSDEESGIPKPIIKPMIFKNFNMDRLKEVERQRQETALTFEEEKIEKIKKTSESRGATGTPGSSQSKSTKQRDFGRLNSGKFRKSLSVSSDVDSLDGISNMSVKNESSGENDYSETSGSGKLSEKVLTPIVSLELDDIAFNNHVRREPGGGLLSSVNAEVEQELGAGGPRKKSLARQDTLETLFRSGQPGQPSQPRYGGSKLSGPGQKYFSSPLASLHISRLGGEEEEDEATDLMLARSLATTGLAQLGGAPARKVGGGGKLSLGSLHQPPLIQNLSPLLPGENTRGLSVLDLSRVTRTPSLPASGLNNRRRRKKTLAAPRGLTKEEYFSRLENF